MTNTEKMDRGLLWGDTDEYLEEQARAKDLMYEFNMSRPSDVEKRAKLIPQIFNVQGEVFIQQPITLARGKTVTIGNGTWINSGLTLIDDYKITIGQGCILATNVTIATCGHPIDPVARAKGAMYAFPVTIGNNVWIGANVTILPNVTIGDHCVIGAGSVVTKDIPANTVAAGNPCRVLREIGEYDKQFYFKGHSFDDCPEWKE